MKPVKRAAKSAGLNKLYQFWGSEVRRVRTEQGLRQVDLAKRCKVPQQHISRVENGVNRPSDELRIAIGKVLKVDPNELFAYPERKEDASVS